jgi:flagellar biosynthesis/type III secretory pathway protein FliH
MISESIDLWEIQLKQQGLQQGMKQGMQQGQIQGILVGEAKTLKRLLVRRFGPLPASIEARIDVAAAEQLDAWLDALLDASSLEAVFVSH